MTTLSGVVGQGKGVKSCIVGFLEGRTRSACARWYPQRAPSSPCSQLYYTSAIVYVNPRLMHYFAGFFFYTGVVGGFDLEGRMVDTLFIKRLCRAGNNLLRFF